MGSDSGSATSKSSSRRVKFEDEYGNNEHSSEGSQSSKGSDTHSDVSNMIEETKSNDSRDNPDIIIGQGNTNDVALHKGADDESGDSKISEVGQVEIDETEKFSSSSSSPSPLPSPSSSPGLSTHDQSQSDMKLSSRIATSKPKVSSLSTSIQSPPIQVMDRQVGKFDPNRIPPVVFAPHKSTPTDWSVGSNESLFSIRVESSVFSRDPYKQSGDYTKRPEFKTSTPSTVAPKVHTKGPKINRIKEKAAIKNKTLLIAEQQNMEQPKLPIVAWKPNASVPSGKSGAREQPLDFPLKNDKNSCAWASCSCCACSWALCYCSNYSCALCYCWNCSIKRWWCGCCSDYEDENDVSEVEKAHQKQKHQEEPLASALESKSSCSCCSWFRCCPKDEVYVPDKEKAHQKQRQQEKTYASASKSKSKSSCSNCCSWFCSSSEDENNVPEKEKAQHKQKHQEKPLASALESKSSCNNCFSCFLSCCSCNCCRKKCCC